MGPRQSTGAMPPWDRRPKQQLRAGARVGDYHVWCCTFKRRLRRPRAAIHAWRRSAYLCKTFDTGVKLRLEIDHDAT
jgi:hypothetical protein